MTLDTRTKIHLVIILVGLSLLIHMGNQAFADQRAREMVDRIETRIDESRTADRPLPEIDFSDLDDAVVITDTVNGSLIVHVGRDVCVAANATTTARC